MPRKTMAMAGSVCLALAAGCDGEVPTPADAGDGLDEGFRADLGTPPAPEYLDFRVYARAPGNPGEKGAPISSAIVALDLPAGRRQLMTDASGRARFTLPDGVSEVTLTAAKVGWLPAVTLYRATLEEIGEQVAAAGELYVLMEPPPETPPATVQLDVTSTVTESFCVSAAVWDVCTRTGTASLQVPRAAAPLELVAYSVDADLCPIDLVEMTVPDTLQERSVVLPFDRPSPARPKSVDVHVRLPPDEESVMRLQGVYMGARFPMLVLDPSASRIRGGTCRERPGADAMTYEVTVSWFDPRAGAPIFQLIFFPDYPGAHNGDEMAFAWETLQNQPAPGAAFEVFDVARMEVPLSGLSLDTKLEFSAVPGARQYEILLFPWARLDVILWEVRSFRHQPVELPDLPGGYDRAVDWPSTRAVYRVLSCERALVWPNPWPLPAGSRCSESRPIVGDL